MTGVKDHLARLDVLKSDRRNYEPAWQDIRDYIRPSGDGFQTERMPGSRNNPNMLDNTAELAAELLASALMSELANPTTKWFAQRFENAAFNRAPAKAAWLEFATNRMFDVFNSPDSKFATAMHEIWLDTPSYGTGCIFTAQRLGAAPLFQSRPLSECYLAQNDEGTIDTVYRSFRMSARAALRQWGESAGEKVVKAAGDPKKQDQPFEFLHAVTPRSDRDPGRGDARNMPISSTWISIDDKHRIAEGGYPEMPYATPRWSRRSGEVYGRGPGHKAIADTLMLQRVMKVTIRGAEKTVDPVIMRADDGVMSPVTSQKNGIINVAADWLRAGRDPLKALNTGARPDIGEDFMAGIRARIQLAFHANLIQFPEDPRMSATQFLKLQQKTLQILNPVLGRLQPELLGPMIDRVFGIMLRQGEFDPVPDDLAGARIEIEYVSPVAKAQRLSEAIAIAQTYEVLAPFLQLDPTIADNQDTDTSYRRVAELFGQPQSQLRDPKTVRAMRDKRAEAAEAKEEMEQIKDAASAAGKAAPALELLSGGRDAA